MVTAEMTSGAERMSPRARRTLLALIAVCVLPVVASYLAFYVWQPSARMNFGTLVSPEPLPRTALADLDGRSVETAVLTGAWTYLVVAPSDCDAACAEALYLTRQVRTAQAKEMDRVARIWLVSDGGSPDAAVLEGHEGLRVLRADATWRARFEPAGTPRVWLVDPQGNVMMRYPDALEAKGMVKDLARLLKYSQQG
jgi:cytochrome oxidase Cu insertion factor (SCO1/SenC/PrrC family)